MHLTGDQWGVMNETGSYPGQPWLWLFQMWYHVHGWSNSDNIDLIAIYMTGLATILLLFIPFIPGLRDIPRWIPVHRLVWRNWNQQAAAGAHGAIRTRTQARTRRAEVAPPPRQPIRPGCNQGVSRLHPGLCVAGQPHARHPYGDDSP